MSDRTGVVVWCLAAATVIAVSGVIVLIRITPTTDPVAWVGIWGSVVVAFVAIGGGVFTGGR